MKHLALVIGILLIIGAASSAEAGDWKFKGLAFGDYYYVASATLAKLNYPRNAMLFKFVAFISPLKRMSPTICPCVTL